MSLQLEHKTEKGTLCYVKVPDDYNSAIIEDDALTIWQNNKFGSWVGYASLSKGDWQLIALTSEVTEEQAKMMVSIFDFDSNHFTYLDYFKSLMKFLKVYEVNPICWISPKSRAIYFDSNKERKEAVIKWENAEQRTGKWIVLFKNNIL